MKNGKAGRANAELLACCSSDGGGPSSTLHAWRQWWTFPLSGTAAWSELSRGERALGLFCRALPPAQNLLAYPSCLHILLPSLFAAFACKWTSSLFLWTRI